MVIGSNAVEKLIEELSNPLNLWLHEGSGRSIKPEQLDQCINELRRREQLSVTKGAGEYELNIDGVRFIAVGSSTRYSRYVNDIVNFYVNMITMLRQVKEIVGKLGLEGDFTIILSDMVELVIGPSLGDMSSLLNLAEPVIRVEFPSGLSVIRGISDEERIVVERALDKELSKGDVVIERRINLEEYNLPLGMSNEG